MHVNSRVTSADGLRGLAALNVAIYHFAGALFPVLLYRNTAPVKDAALTKAAGYGFWFDILDFPILSLLYNGHFPVLIFFVLSGYVLATPYYEGREQALRDRLWGRYLRLNMAVFFTTILSYGVQFFGLYYNAETSALTGDAWIGSFFQNVPAVYELIKIALFKTLFLGDTQFNPPTWSIRVEFIGSVLLLGFYIFKTSRFVKLGIIAILGIIMPVIVFALIGQQVVNCALIFIGSLLHVVPKFSRRNIIFLGCLGIYLGCYKYNSMFYDFLPTVAGQDKNLYNAIGALCLTYAVINNFGASVFSAKIPQYLGRISYSLYLTHFILLCSIFCFLFTMTDGSLMAVALIFALYIPATIAFAHVFTVIVDEPAIKLAKTFARYVRTA